MPNWTKEQQEAIEKDGSNIIVSAGAGSGKTAVLSARVLHKLKNGTHIDELLILTFTRAAAEEMKDRIRDLIAKDPGLKRELDALDSSYITTFDSFALSVVKKYHYLLNIKKDIAITDEAIVLLEKNHIIDEVFESKYDSGDERFLHLIKRYCLKSDKPLKKVLGELIKKFDGLLNRDGLLSFLESEFWTDEHLDKIVADYKGLIEEKKKIAGMELENCYHYFDGEYIDKINAVVLPIINSTSIEELASHKGFRLPNLPRGSEDETKLAKENLKKALTDIFLLINFGDEANVKSDIMSTKETSLAFVDLLKAYYARLDAFKAEHDIYTFADVASLAIKIVSDFEPARRELKDKFKEIMIDEYQDTNDVQETFISYIAKDNVYMVGDIKQSIYRFRGSNPSIFKDKYDHYSKEDGGKKIDLIKNFRSREEVLENINRIFDLLMDDALGGAAYTVSHEMVYGNSTYDEKRVDGFDYNCRILEYPLLEDGSFNGTEIEIFAIARDIQKKMIENFQVFDKHTSTMRPFRYSDAVIILDTSRTFDQFKKVFEYLGIPLTILKDEKLTTTSDILIIKNAVDLLTRIYAKDFGIDFRYDFLSIGRSFLYEYTDAYLFDIIKNGTYRETELFKDFANIEDFASMSINDFLEFILEKTKFYDKIYKIGDYENTLLRIAKILEMAKGLSDMGYTIFEFREYLNDIVKENLEIKYTAFIGDADSVKILTIHKSKGLEYPVCYFADLTHDFNTMELKKKFIASSRYGIITPVQLDSEEEVDSVTKTLFKANFMREEIGEKIRLFYVALTRAREQMIIVLPKKDTVKLEKNRVGTIEEIRRLKFKGLSDFVYGIKDHLPRYFEDLDPNALGLSKDYLYNKPVETIVTGSVGEEFVVENLNIEGIETSRKRFSKDRVELVTKEDADSMAFGTKIHEILEYIDFKNYDSRMIEDDFIRRKIDALMNNDLLSDIQNAKIFQEYEFVYEENNTLYHGSIDLMLEYADHIDIIDYKLKNTTSEYYKAQVAGYKRYIEKISSKRVNTYLYSIIDERVIPIGE